MHRHSYLTTALSELGKHEEALSLLDEMVEKRGMAPDEISFSTMIYACGKAGEWRRALGLLHAMEANLSINAARGRGGRGRRMRRRNRRRKKGDGSWEGVTWRWRRRWTPAPEVASWRKG